MVFTIKLHFKSYLLSWFWHSF